MAVVMAADCSSASQGLLRVLWSSAAASKCKQRAQQQPHCYNSILRTCSGPLWTSKLRHRCTDYRSNPRAQQQSTDPFHMEDFTTKGKQLGKRIKKLFSIGGSTDTVSPALRGGKGSPRRRAAASKLTPRTKASMPAYRSVPPTSKVGPRPPTGSPTVAMNTSSSKSGRLNSCLEQEEAEAADTIPAVVLASSVAAAQLAVQQQRQEESAHRRREMDAGAEDVRAVAPRKAAAKQRQPEPARSSSSHGLVKSIFVGAAVAGIALVAADGVRGSRRGRPSNSTAGAGSKPAAGAFNLADVRKWGLCAMLRQGQ